MSQRTSTYSNTLVDGGSNPRVGVQVIATLLVPGNVNPVDGSGTPGDAISKKTLIATTDSGGAYSFTLDYPGDFTSPAGCTWQFDEEGTITILPVGYSYSASYTVSDFYGAAPASGTWPMILTLETGDQAGVGGSIGSVYLSQNGVGTNDVVYSASKAVTSTTDGAGLWTWHLTPNANIDPAATTWTLVMDTEPGVFVFTVPADPTGWQGTYDSGTAYHVNAGTFASPSDVVLSSGVYYQCIADTTGNAPPNGTYWHVWPGEPVLWNLTSAVAPTTVSISPDNIRADSDLGSPISGAPNPSPVTLDDNLENIKYQMEHQVLDGTTVIPLAQTPLLNNSAAGGSDQYLMSSGSEVLWAKGTAMAMFADPTRTEGAILYRKATAVSSLVIGFIGDDSSLDTYGVPAAVITAITGNGVTITKNNQAVAGSTSGDWLHTGTNYSTALTAFSGAGVRIVHVMLGLNDSRVSHATTQSTYGSNLRDLVQHLQAAGYLVVVSQPHAVVTGSDSGDFNSTSNTLLYSYATEVNRVVNGYGAVQGDTMAFGVFNAHGSAYFSNGWNPNSSGRDALSLLWQKPLLRLAQVIGWQTSLQTLAIGTSGQVLTVSAGYPAWGAGGGSSVTTKGDLQGYDTGAARVPIGTNGQVLTADSAQSLGLKWATPFANPMTTEGDLIQGGSSGAATRLPLGLAGQVISPVGSDVAWVTQSSPGGLIDPTTTDGQLLYRHATTTTSLVIGGIGDSIMHDIPPSGSVNPLASAASALSIGGLTITSNDQAVAGTTSTDWVSGSTDLIAAKTAFAGASVRVVLYMIGTNDSKNTVATTAAQFLLNVQSTVRDLVAAGYIVVLAYAPYAVPGSGSGIWDATSDTLLLAYQAKITTLVDNAHVFLGDTSAYLYFKANQAKLYDGIHPTSTGGTDLGNLWAAGLQRVVAAMTGQQPIQPLALGSGLSITAGVLSSSGGKAYSILTDGASNLIFAAGDVISVAS